MRTGPIVGVGAIREECVVACRLALKDFACSRQLIVLLLGLAPCRILLARPTDVRRGELRKSTWVFEDSNEDRTEMRSFPHLERRTVRLPRVVSLVANLQMYAWHITRPSPDQRGERPLRFRELQFI